MKTNRLNSCADAELVLGFQTTKSTDFFNELYRRYYRQVLRYCTGILHDGERASDIAQEIFIKMLDKIDSLHDPRVFTKWLFRVAHNHCIDFLKTSSRRSFVPLPQKLSLLDEELDLDQEMAMVSQTNARLEAIRQLPDGSRALLMAKYCEDKSIQDLQSEYGLSASAVKMRLARARQRVVGLYDDPYMETFSS